MIENRPKKITHLIECLNRLPKKDSHIDLWYRLDIQFGKYLALEIPWDGKLIEVVGKIGETKYRVKEISTFDNVMDTAREFLYE